MVMMPPVMPPMVVVVMVVVVMMMVMVISGELHGGVAGACLRRLYLVRGTQQPRRVINWCKQIRVALGLHDAIEIFR